MALPDTIQLKASTDRSTGISASSLSDGAGVVSSEIDNSSNLDDFADIQLTWSYGTSRTANKSLIVYFIYAIDGTNYDDGSTSVQPIGVPCLVVSPSADTATHRHTVNRVPLGPHKLKAVVWNKGTGQTATVTLLVRTYNRKQVD